MSTESLTIAPSEFSLDQLLNDEEFRDMAGGLFVNGRTGNRWLLTLEYRNRTGSDRRTLWGHVGQARGRRNRIRVPMSLLNYSRAGAGGGSPQLVGAHSAGAVQLSIDGAAVSTTWLKSGDFIGVGNELKLVTGDVSTETASPGGAGTVNIWPELHQDYADNTAVDLTPHGDFFVVDVQGIGGQPFRSDWLNRSVTLVLEEDVNA